MQYDPTAHKNVKRNHWSQFHKEIHSKIDFEHLNALYNNEAVDNVIREQCGVWEPLKTRRTTCGELNLYFITAVLIIMY